MIKKIDKDKVIQEFKEKYVVDRYKEEVIKIEEKYYSDKEKIKEELISKFNFVCQEAIILQEKELKGEIKYIYFSILRTRILENKGIWRIDLLDDKWFLDKEECSINIEFDFVYEPLFIHMQELLEKRKEYGRTIKESDIKLIKLEEANKYQKIIEKIIKDMVKDLLRSEVFRQMKQKKDIAIMAGEYMDVTTKIYPRK